MPWNLAHKQIGVLALHMKFRILNLKNLIINNNSKQQNKTEVVKFTKSN